MMNSLQCVVDASASRSVIGLPTTTARVPKPIRKTTANQALQAEGQRQLPSTQRQRMANLLGSVWGNNDATRFSR
eukprot:765655-Amphidinium_carterae.4